LSIFVAVVAALLALLTLLLHRRLAVAPAWPRPVRRVVAVVLAVGWAAILAAFAIQGGVIDPRGTRWLAWFGMTWLAVAWYLLLGVLTLGILSLATRLVRPAARSGLLRIGTPLVAVAALCTTAYGLHEAAEPSVTPVTVTDRDLPAEFDGLRVALVTDLHVGPVRDA